MPRDTDTAGRLGCVVLALTLGLMLVLDITSGLADDILVAFAAGLILGTGLAPAGAPAAAKGR